MHRDPVAAERDRLVQAHGLVRIDCPPDVRLVDGRVVASASRDGRDHLIVLFHTVRGVILEEAWLDGHNFTICYHASVSLARISVQQHAADEARVRAILRRLARSTS